MGTAASMVAGTLYTYPDNFRAFKALIAAKYSGAQLTVAKDFVFGETNKKPEFLKKFPLGKVPAFEGSDGVLLTESNAIAYYVANDELRGALMLLPELRLCNGCVWQTTRSCRQPVPGSFPRWASCSTTRRPRKEPRRTSRLLLR